MAMASRRNMNLYSRNTAGLATSALHPAREIARRTGLSVRQAERQMTKAIYKTAKQMDDHSLSWWKRWF